MRIETPNTVLNSVTQVSGSRLCVVGILNWDFENRELLHWPKTERNQDIYQSSLWIDDPSEPFGLNEETLRKWSGKKVAIEGEIRAAHEAFGTGHMGLWRAEIKPVRIDLFKDWLPSHPEYKKQQAAVPDSARVARRIRNA